MEEVGLHLRAHALVILPTQEREADLFGRSAFNRLYYSAYLTTKSILGEVLSDMPRSHKGTPEYLRGLATGRIAHIKRAAVRAGDHKLRQDCTNAKVAVDALAGLLEGANTVRETADYFPEIPVLFKTGHSFSLNATEVELAKAWPNQARQYARTILLVLKQA